MPRPHRNTIPPRARPRRWLLICTLAAAGTAMAGGRFSVDSHTVDGGGSHSQGSRFSVEGTIGQPDAGPAHDGARFSVTGGFWQPQATPPVSNVIFSNGFED